MQRHLIALDLDGTTLNNQSKLSEKTIRTLNALQKEGHIVTIVTGRPYLISHHIYDQLGLKSPMVNFNGALTHIPHQHWDGEYARTVSRDLTLSMLEETDQLGVKTLIAEDKLHVWANRPSNTIPEFIPNKLEEDQILNEKNLTGDPIALTFEFDPKKKDEILSQIDVEFGNEVEPRVWGGGYDIMELISRGTHKEDGLDHVAHYYGIPKDRILAFGDEANDYEMLDYAGHGVAMQNAIPKIKEVADDVTELDNDHDGLAAYLEKYFKLDA